MISRKIFTAIRNLPPARRGKRAYHYKHGHYAGGHRSPSYVSWMSMIARCEHNPAYSGVQVCKRWREDFRAFLQDMGERPVGLTLDKRNPAGKLYAKNTTRWATRSEQVRNRRITDRFRKSAWQNMAKARAARKP